MVFRLSVLLRWLVRNAAFADKERDVLELKKVLSRAAAK